MTQHTRAGAGSRTHKKIKAKKRKVARAPAGAPPGKVVAQEGALPTRLYLTRVLPDKISHPKDLDTALDGLRGAPSGKSKAGPAAAGAVARAESVVPDAAPGAAPDATSGTTPEKAAEPAPRAAPEAAPPAGDAARTGAEVQGAPRGWIWIDIAGLDDVEKIQAICQRLHLHQLSVADIFNTGQRPKAEIYDGYVQIVLRQPLSMDPYIDEQLTLILGDGFVLTVQETPDDCFDPVRQRLKAGGPRIRSNPGYLAYALMDSLIDAYFPYLEAYGEHTEALEDRILDGEDGMVTEIHALRRELVTVRHTLWPQREAVSALLRHDVPFIDEELRTYLRDVADHSTQLIDMLEVYREVAQGLVDLHLSMLSNRMNEVMRVLTVISTIFIPMTFIAGLYGMNFTTDSPWNMPELKWHYGYLYSLGLMALSAGTMLLWFWRKGWLRRKGDEIAPSKTPHHHHHPYGHVQSPAAGTGETGAPAAGAAPAEAGSGAVSAAPQATKVDRRG
ncbi:magnesium/cobalt transporter CorA [Acidimangrovimonas sediminis]|uniref:magnesium/cobalt transporter CorA n=1 Tax=Acidimangrovimonas sediminis TaxID=2056283 RepID=UPI000C805E8E|nr:magnesium/cobalt transporter CorA [Acidimangrovimonas sediminis]